jgi:acetyltransferase-like isoleucine patch superfamily enzyme
MKSMIMHNLKHFLKNRINKFREKINVHFMKKHNTGKDSYVAPSVQVLGWRNFRVGQNSIISEDTWININHRTEGNISVIIGDNCFIGRRNFFTSGNLIKIGNYCLTGVDCKFLGSGHIYDDPFIPYLVSATTEEGLIEIGSNCWLGANVTILKNIKIGYGSIIGASSLVNQDIPPLSVVVGNPCRVIRRFDMKLKIWVNSKDYSKESDQYLLSESEYLEILNKNSFDMRGLVIENADYATVLGNKFTIDTYSYAKKPIYRIPISTNVQYPWLEDKNYESCCRNFLWFGSSGLVHKGLDLVLEAFAKMPEYHLTVCGPVNNEKDFENAFYQELYQTPNIHTTGWVNVSDSKFTEIVKNCIGLIYPSCSEGGGGSVINCMHAGLIPIVSYESSVDVMNFGFILADSSIEEIQNQIKTVSNLPLKELELRARKSWEFAVNIHVYDNFSQEYYKFATQVLGIKQ